MTDIEKNMDVTMMGNKEEQTSQIRRYRTINNVVREVNALDSESAICPNFVRRMCDQNKVRSFKWGNKWLVDLDDFIRVMNSENFMR